MRYVGLCLWIGLMTVGLMMVGAERGAGAHAASTTLPPSSNAAPPSTASALSLAVDPTFPEAFTERSMGNTKAPVVITVYSALTCSHCADFFLGTFPDLKKNYVDTGKVRFIFKEFAFNLVGLHAAMATHCVDPKSYFDLVLTLFRTQNSWALNSNGEGVVRQMAGFAGLSPDKYTACTSSRQLEDYFVQERTKATRDLGVNSTPTFILSGGIERIVGAQDYATFSALIDRQLAKAAAATAAGAANRAPSSRPAAAPPALKK